MTEERYRLSIVILVAVFVAGSLTLQFLASQNGRYVQYDLRGTYSPDGGTRLTDPPYHRFDTRTGRIDTP